MEGGAEEAARDRKHRSDSEPTKDTITAGRGNTPPLCCSEAASHLGKEVDRGASTNEATHPPQCGGTQSGVQTHSA